VDIGFCDTQQDEHKKDICQKEMMALPGGRQ